MTGSRHPGGRPPDADLLDALVRNAFHASMAMHAALASTNDRRTADHIRRAIGSVHDVIEGARYFALGTWDRTPEE